MDIKQIKSALAAEATATAKGGGLLEKLAAAGLFKATVLQQATGKMILQTDWGQLSGNSLPQLEDNDQVLARVLSERSTPTIKIETRLRESIIKLPEATLKNLSQQLSTLSIPLHKADNPRPVNQQSNQQAQVFFVRVVNQNERTTTLEISGKQFTLEGMPRLKPAESLMVKSENNQLTVFRIKPEVVLKQAIQQLIPILSRNQSDQGLLTIAQTVRHMLAAQPNPILPKVPATDHPKLNAARPDTEFAPRLQNQIKEPVHATPGQAQAESNTHKQLTRLLQQLQQLPVNIKAENPKILAQLLTLAELQKTPTTAIPVSGLPTQSTSSTSSQAADSLPKLLLSLLKLVQKEQGMEPVTSRLTPQKASAAPQKSGIENTFPDTFSPRQQLAETVEQNLAQLLVQKSTVKLQQELQQPIQFNLSLPVKIDDKQQQLKLEVRQRNHQGDSEHQQWEVKLEFEFGGLGLISTHVHLQDNRISVHFWSEKDHTRQLIDQQMDSFRSQLLNAGLEVGRLVSLDQKPVESSSENGLALPDKLLDIRV